MLGDCKQTKPLQNLAASLTVCTPLCSPPAVKYERIKFLVIALKNAVEIYAWAPKPYHKFMAFKVRRFRTRSSV